MKLLYGYGYHIRWYRTKVDSNIIELPLQWASILMCVCVYLHSDRSIMYCQYSVTSNCSRLKRGFVVPQADEIRMKILHNHRKSVTQQRLRLVDGCFWMSAAFQMKLIDCGQYSRQLQMEESWEFAIDSGKIWWRTFPSREISHLDSLE